MHTSLRAQVQPFQTYTPQQIQEQLQHLHIQQCNESESSVHSAAPGVAALLQQPPQPPPTALDGRSLEASPTKESNSVLHHLLSQSPKPVSIIQSNPVGHNQVQRSSFHESMATPLLASQLHQKSQDAAHSPSDLSAMIDNVASRPNPNHDLPSFPVNIQTREGSPTKGVGRRSPISDYQMASIVEDTSEEITGLTTQQFVANSPVSMLQHTMPNGMGRQSEQGYCNIPGLQLHINHPTDSQQFQSQVSASNGTNRYHHYYVQHGADHVNMPIMPTTLNPVSNPQTILNRISTVLSNNRIHHYQSNGGFVVEHDSVKLLIACNSSYPNHVRMQFIAGDPMQYQKLSTHIAAQLQ